MSGIAEAFGPEVKEMLQKSLDREAAKIAGEKGYSGSAAMREFNLSRNELRHITPTYPPGCKKPIYLFKHISAYRAQTTAIK